MPKFMVEREILGIGTWSADRLRKTAEKSRAVLREMGPDIQWLTSYVTDDRLYCVYIAPGPALIAERAARGGFPCNRVSLVQDVTAPAHAFVREAGRGPAVVCIHASASTSAQWRPLTDRLGDRYRLVSGDLYGSGQSPPWPGDRSLTLADERRLLAPAFEAAGGRFHLIGHSYGGAVALEVARAEPGMVASLVLFEPVLFSLLVAEDPAQPAAREIAAVRDDTVAAFERGDPHASGARFVDYWMGAGAWAAMPAPRRDGLARAMGAVRTEWAAAFGNPTPLSAFAGLDVPVLLLTGSESPASSRGVTRLLAKTLPRVTVIDVEGVGHMGPVTHPDRINAVIERYLDAGSALPGAA